MATHALQFGNPCLVADQVAVEDFAYDFWATQWRTRRGANNSPIQDGVRKLLVNWRVEVVGDEPERKPEWFDPKKRTKNGAGRVNDGFFFAESVDLRDGKAQVTITFRREQIEIRGTEPPPAVLVVEAQVIAGEKAGPMPKPADGRVILRAGSVHRSMDKAADALEAAFVPLAISKWDRVGRKPDDTTIAVFRRVIDYSAKMKRVAAARGFASVTLLTMSGVLMVVSLLTFLWLDAQTKGIAREAKYLMQSTGRCVNGESLVEVHGVVPSPTLPWVIIRDDRVLRALTATELRGSVVHLSSPPLGMEFSENLSFIDRDVLAGESHAYELGVRLPFGRLHRTKRTKPVEPSIVPSCSQ